MQPPRQHPRINLAELKAQIVKKLGPEKSKQYFYYLNSLLSLKVTKIEFDKLCLKILGRDNIPLHNQLIRSILKNVCTGKPPPPPPQSPPERDGNVSKHGPEIIGKRTSIDNNQHNGLGLSNGGDMLLPPSPKKARTGLRDRRGGDRRSALGDNGKISFAPQPVDLLNVVLENGGSVPTHHGFLNRSENKNGILASVVKDEEKGVLPKSPIRAPLGIPFCPASSGGGIRTPPDSRRRTGSVFKDGVLLDSVNLKERMEEIASTEGLEGVSLDSANLLNHGLDSYLKRLISSWVELVGSGQTSEITNNNNNHKSTDTRRVCGVKLVNGVKPGHENLLAQEKRNRDFPISLRDFRVAMEMNPRKLGEDWPLLLEKICTSSFEE